ncbi:flagellar hook-length control protein FliK [Pseudoalteromonas atlantica]|uniref:flagellar hook-length control protein FliK n=1 Tax=Pseudoalteromonas atlantica TaxID=288 RepID=UPI0037356078
MAINDLSALISTEQDIKFAKKEQSQQAAIDEKSGSESDFFSQLQSANSATEEPNKKSKGSASPQLSESDTQDAMQSKQKKESAAVISGDDMLAQINAANNLDTRVSTSEPNNSLTSVSELIDKYAQESLDPKDIKPKAPRPIDDVTPIINKPLEDDSSEGLPNNSVIPSDKSAVAEAIDKNLKQTGFPEDAVTPIVDDVQAIKAPETQNGTNKSASSVDMPSINASTENTKNAQPLASLLAQESVADTSKGEAAVLQEKVNKNQVDGAGKAVVTDSDVALKAPTKPVDKKGEVNPEALSSSLNTAAKQSSAAPAESSVNSQSKNDKTDSKSSVSAQVGDAKSSVEIPAQQIKDSKEATKSAVNKGVEADTAQMQDTAKIAKTVGAEPTLSKDAQALKDAFIAAQSPTTSAAVKTTQSASEIAKSSEVNQTVMKLLNAETDVLTGSDQVLSRLTTEQRATLQTQVNAVLSQGVDKQGLANLKHTVAQFIANNNSANSAQNVDATSSFNAVEFSDEIANLATGQKQALSEQLQQFLATEKPQGAVLNQVKAALAVLDENQMTMTKESTTTLKEPLQVAQPIATNQVETAKAQSGQATFVKMTAQEQAIKSDIQQDVAKEALVADDEKIEQIASKESNAVRVNQLFTQVTNIASTSMTQSINEAIDQRYSEELSNMQVLNAQQTSATSQTKQVNVDPTLMQALNIVKSDAAKLLQERVSALLSINNKEAEIRLDPPEMGSMQIRIRSDAEQAQINFVVQNQQAKEALEQSMPKLREMLAEQGIELGESSIQQGDSQGNADEQEQQQGRGQLASNGQSDDGAADSEPSAQSSGQQSSSSIDYYA